MEVQEQNQYLNDITLRMQFYFELVKNHYIESYIKGTWRFRLSVRDKLRAIDGDSLRLVRKKDFDALLRDIRNDNKDFYKEFSDVFFDDLEYITGSQFTFAQDVYAHSINAIFDVPNIFNSSLILEAHRKENDIEPVYGYDVLDMPESFYGKVLKEPLAATGALTKTGTQVAFSRLGVELENSLIKSRLDNETVAEATKKVVGSSPVGFSSVMDKFDNTLSSLVSTIFHNFFTKSNVAVASTFFKYFRWTSIIDGGTSNICRSRDKAIFSYRTGPFPPAHPNCRSSITPVTNDVELKNESLRAWIMRQNLEFQKDIMTAKQNMAMRTGTIDKFRATKSLAPEAYFDKMDRIVG
jgi:SPP1 gp7 family putative phage head morphogenesis protein